jgi:hypothetical protein
MNTFFRYMCAALLLLAFSMHRDVARYPYYDYDLERLVTE